MRTLHPIGTTSPAPFIGRVCANSALPEAARAREVLLVGSGCDPLPPGFRGYLLDEPPPGTTVPRDTYLLGESTRHLAHGDVIRLDPNRGAVSVHYRRASLSNALLVTERCDNFCVMCPQPPKPKDDPLLLEEIEEVIALISPETRDLSITGGEPALLGERLVQLVDTLRRHLPRTAIHLLSNGRRFADPAFAESLARVRHPDLMVGIPLYSDLPEEHDYVVQARGAFSETVRGILNLKRLRQRVEIRFVAHAETHERLPDFARFLARNLLFVDHVALMGLELVGFARTNLDALWVDPLDYQGALLEAVEVLDRAGMSVSIYGHQLCVLDERLHRFAVKAISDWKNTYVEACRACAKRGECGGFFASASTRHSRGIRALPIDA
ncbi:MAG TPA: His-Xaa-Ser system radical SAM maturase HxsC [Polyangiaceae bacterium]